MNNVEDIRERIKRARCEVCQSEGVRWPACEEEGCPFAFLAEQQVEMPPPTKEVFEPVLRMFLSAIIGGLTVVGLIVSLSKFFGWA